MRYTYAVIGQGQRHVDTEAGTDVLVESGKALFATSDEADVVPDGPDPSDEDHRE